MEKEQKTVAYFYDDEFANFNYGGGNPMRPHRIRLTHSLVSNYGLENKMLLHRPQSRTVEQLTEFHADDYIHFLKAVTPNNQEEYMTQLRRFNLGLPGEADCPVFDGLFDYCAMYSGGSVDGARLLSEGTSDIAINWSGGMHHAKKAEASGFCYVNDIVMAILELLKTYARVLYVDIDIHHGDGVEEAFYLTDRVMTVSFHKYGEFFPGTGALGDYGTARGKYYTVNVPLKDGMDDESYRSLFEPIMTKVMELYQPEAIVMCCGADSLSGDRLGCFNLSLEGHSNCIEFLKRFGVPLLILGGGGYTMRNVARCWCYETGRMMGVDLPDELPQGALAEYNYYLDTQRLRIAVSNMKNTNNREELEAIKHMVLQHLQLLPPSPSVGLGAPRPPSRQLQELPEEDLDVRGGGRSHAERRIVRDGDESDGEEEAGGRRHPGESTWRDEDGAAADEAGIAPPEGGWDPPQAAADEEEEEGEGEDEEQDGGSSPDRPARVPPPGPALLSIPEPAAAAPAAAAADGDAAGPSIPPPQGPLPVPKPAEKEGSRPARVLPVLPFLPSLAAPPAWERPSE